MPKDLRYYPRGSTRRVLPRKPSSSRVMKTRPSSRPLAPAITLRPRTGSRTMVMRRRKLGLKVQKVTPTAGLTSHSMFKSHHRPTQQVKAMKRVGAPNIYITNGANQTICDEGYQNASFVTWNQIADLKTMLTRTPNNFTPIAGTYKTSRYVLESGQFELLITNSSLASAYVEIYDIARKRDANETEFPFTKDPLSAWQQGVYNATQLVSSDWQNIHSSPFDSQVFKDWFKVVKRTRVELSQGAIHRHAVLLEPNRVIDASLPQFIDGDVAGLTMYTMVVFNGQPASIPPKSPDDSVVVTTAKVALDFVSSSRYKYTFVQDTTQSVYIVDNLSSLAGEELVSTGAGDIVLNKIV